MRIRVSLIGALVCIAAGAVAVGPARATDATPVYQGYACNIDGTYQCGGTCPKDGCWCCEKPVKTCSGR